VIDEKFQSKKTGMRPKRQANGEIKRGSGMNAGKRKEQEGASDNSSSSGSPSGGRGA